MQDVTTEICNNTETATETTGTYTLTDKRDNKTYTVAKLKDGKCWMTQNLALELSTSRALTNQDTDLNNVTSWTPERNTIASNALSSSTWANSNTDPYSYKSSTASYGVYYNWTAAIASNDSSSLTTAYSNAPDSICPKGWRLPVVYNGSSSNFPNEFGKLLKAYGYIANETSNDQSWTNNGYTKIQQAPINVTLIGYISNTSSLLQVGNHFNFNSSTIATYPSYYRFSGSSDRHAAWYVEGGRFYGFAVRCLVY